MPTWFTVTLDDRPGSLARLAAALGDRGVNITGIVGVAEDTGGSLMLTTSDPAVTREVLAALELPGDEHPDGGGAEMITGLARGLADR
jgi:hypothetical protein